MAQVCIATTKKGVSCKNKTKEGSFCYIHSGEKNIKKPEKPEKLAITITFSECCENHVGMQKISKSSVIQEGFNHDDLLMAKEKFDKLGAICELHLLNDALNEVNKLNELEVNKINNINEINKAYVLIIRNGVNILLNDVKKSTNDVMNEMLSFEWDSRAKMYGRVVNKHARQNVCFADQSQESDIENGKGTIIKFNDIKCVNHVRNKLGEFLGEKGESLLAEGNRYNDVDVNGIGWHGDLERKRVVAIRLGHSMPLCFSWFLRFNPVGKIIKFMLNDGDMYIMDDKSTGNDGKRSSILTLKHCAGAEKYMKFKDKKIKKRRKAENNICEKYIEI